MDIWMLPDFRGNLRGPSRNRLDIKFMNTFFIKFSVDGVCTASVTTRDPGNDTPKKLERIWILEPMGKKGWEWKVTVISGERPEFVRMALKFVSIDSAVRFEAAFVEAKSLDTRSP